MKITHFFFNLGFDAHLGLLWDAWSLDEFQQPGNFASPESQ
jgi:hypothetical protein